MLLAGDIGGTKTDLAVFSPERGPRAPLAEAEYLSSAYPGLEPMVRDFLAKTGLPVTRACFDVAGPVIGGTVRLTNLPWALSEADLAHALNLRSVRLVNDLAAIAAAVPLLTDDDVTVINEGEPAEGGTIAVVAPGTGLGESFLTWDGSRYRPYPSEGGHCDFAPTDTLQSDLLRFMRERYDHVSVERVCSGSGIPDLYNFLREHERIAERPDVAARLATAEDRTPVIVDAALDPVRPSALCAATLGLFIAILGAEAGNVALKMLATGGLYLAGGLPMRMIPALQDGRFMQAFRRKGRMSELLDRVPVRVVRVRAALIGTASIGLQEGPP